MTTTTGATYLATALARAGLTHAFIVPTAMTETLIAMEEQAGIERVVTHSEKAAAYMADGYARATGRVGLCMAQNVGRANLAAGLQDAALANAPVLAVTGGPLPHRTARHAYQEIDAFGMFAPVTKSSVHVESVELLPDVLRQALRDATTGCPGPVHIELEGHAGERIEHPTAELDDHLDPRFGATPAFRPAPEAGAVEAALEAIATAQRPVLVAGGGVRTSGAAAELVALAEHLGVPVATSLNAKEVIPADHPLSVGVVGLYCRRSANETVLDADLVVFVGSQTGSQVTSNWRVPAVSTPVVHIDIDPAELGRHYPRTTPVLGDARVTLARMLDLTATAEPPDRSNWRARARGYVAAFYDGHRAAMTSDAVPLRPERLCRDLSQLLPADALLVVDTGHAGMWAGGMVDLAGTGQGFIRAAGSLGWALPASLGAKLGAPERPVVLFTGDGGLWYHIGELETAVRWGIDVVMVVNDNHSLNQELHPYRRAYGGELRGRHHELWRFEDVDLAQVARSMGAKGLRVTRPGQLRDALDEALSTAGPVVVDVVTDMEALAPLTHVG